MLFAHFMTRRLRRSATAMLTAIMVLPAAAARADIPRVQICPPIASNDGPSQQGLAITGGSCSQSSNADVFTLLTARSFSDYEADFTLLIATGGSVQPTYWVTMNYDQDSQALIGNAGPAGTLHLSQAVVTRPSDDSIQISVPPALLGGAPVTGWTAISQSSSSSLSEVSNYASSGQTLYPSTVARVAGPDRVGTAIAASFFPDLGAGGVVLARSDQFADALVGGVVATIHNSPLLLTTTGALETRDLAEIQRVLPAGGSVYLLGGTQALSPTVADALAQAGYQTVRIAGADRYATSVQVADLNPSPRFVLLATGQSFADALAASSAAAANGGVLLLTDGPYMPPEVAAYLQGIGTGVPVFAIGGPAALADPQATPIVGSDRYQTAVMAATKFFAAPSSVGIAAGTAWPDAVAGSATMAEENAPLVLTSGQSLSSSTASYVSSNSNSIGEAYVFGGSATVSDSVVEATVSTMGAVAGPNEAHMVGGSAVTPPTWVARIESVILGNNGTVIRHGCTGSVIAPTWVITAAHCTFDPAQDYTIDIAGHEYIPTAVLTDPAYLAAGGGPETPGVVPDVGLIELDTPVTSNGGSVLPVATSSDVSGFVNQGVTFFGYGQTVKGGFLSSSLNKSPDGAWTLGAGCNIHGERCFTRASWAGHTAITPGDSGGPWVGWKGGWLLLAVESGGECNEPPTTPIVQCFAPYGASPSDSAVASWLSETMSGTQGSNPGTSPPVTPQGAIQISWSTSHPGWISMTTSGFASNTYAYTCRFGSGGDAVFPVTIVTSPEIFDNGHTCYDDIAGDSVSVAIGSTVSNALVVSGSSPVSGQVPPGAVLTISRGSSSGGSSQINLNATGLSPSSAYTVGCWQTSDSSGNGGSQVASFSLTTDGSGSWSGSGCSTSDSVYTNLRIGPNLIWSNTLAPLAGQVPPQTYGEVTDPNGPTHTWSDPSCGCGSQGMSIPDGSTVQVSCRVQGLNPPSANGDPWWYRIASSPWNNGYYASADAFYNTGTNTSGPFDNGILVDPNVPTC